MTKQIGWAEPEIIIGQPRVHKVEGFTYLFAEHMNAFETEVGNYVPGLVRIVQEAYEELFGSAGKPAILFMYMNVPERDKFYNIHVGYVVPAGTPAAGEAKVRNVPPTLVASIITCCDNHQIGKSYGPLMEFMNQNGLQPLDEGWREYFLYSEGPDSNNNITWVQHVAKET